MRVRVCVLVCVCVCVCVCVGLNEIDLSLLSCQVKPDLKVKFFLLLLLATNIKLAAGNIFLWRNTFPYFFHVEFVVYFDQQ